MLTVSESEESSREEESVSESEESSPWEDFSSQSTNNTEGKEH